MRGLAAAIASACRNAERRLDHAPERAGAAGAPAASSSARRAPRSSALSTLGSSTRVDRHRAAAKARSSAPHGVASALTRSASSRAAEAALRRAPPRWRRARRASAPAPPRPRDRRSARRRRASRALSSARAFEPGTKSALRRGREIGRQTRLSRRSGGAARAACEMVAHQHLGDLHRVEAPRPCADCRRRPTWRARSATVGSLRMRLT